MVFPLVTSLSDYQSYSTCLASVSSHINFMQWKPATSLGNAHISESIIKDYTQLW